MINKILFTIFAVIAIWKAFSMLSRLSKSTGMSPTQASPQDRAARPKSVPKSVDLVPCARCGAYVDPKEGCRCATTSG